MRIPHLSTDGTARLWDLNNGQQVGQPMGASSFDNASAVAFSPDGTVLLRTGPAGRGCCFRRRGDLG